MVVVHDELTGVDLHSAGVTRDSSQGAVVLLELQQIHGFHDVADEDKVLDAHDLVDKDLGVDEGHAVEFFVLELVDIDLLSHGRN